jgi:transcriptional regulator with XRE-family HTH domain
MPTIPKEWRPVDIAIRDELASAVKASGLSQREIARRAGFSEGRLRMYLAGERAPASMGEVSEICDAVGIKVVDVVDIVMGAEQNRHTPNQLSPKPKNP